MLRAYDAHGHGYPSRNDANRRVPGGKALVLQRLGTRAVVAEALAEEALNVKLAVKLICQSALRGTRRRRRC
jgi:hypothetical protein